MAALARRNVRASAFAARAAAATVVVASSLPDRHRGDVAVRDSIASASSIHSFMSKLSQRWCCLTSSSRSRSSMLCSAVAISVNRPLLFSARPSKRASSQE